MLDSDLAKLYGVKTKRLLEQVRRNKERFPEDFMFQLTKEEYQSLRSQFATSSWGGRRYLLKNLGKKVFAFSKIDKNGLKILEKKLK